MNDNLLERIEQIDGALYSFYSLTEKSKPVLGSKAVSKFRNTAADIQTLRFNNWVGGLEGIPSKAGLSS